VDLRESLKASTGTSRSKSASQLSLKENTYKVKNVLIKNKFSLPLLKKSSRPTIVTPETLHR